MKKHFPKTTFSKLLLAFVGFGLIPLVALSIIYFTHYRQAVYAVLEENYSEITSYFAKNTSNIFESADRALGDLYEYTSDDGLSLSDMITGLPDDANRSLQIGQALEYSINRSEYISSARIVLEDGSIYSRYNDQTKTLKKEAGQFAAFRGRYTENLRDLSILGTIPEQEVCINSSDYVFSLTRNFMDTSSVANTMNHVLATVYADINVDTIGSLVRDMAPAYGSLYVFDFEKRQYVYSDDQADYTDRPQADFLKAGRPQEASCIKEIPGWHLFYQQIEGTGLYVIYQVPQSAFTNGIAQSMTVFILLLCAACFVILVLYMHFSHTVSQPVIHLKNAMRKVRGGDLTARVEVHANDDLDEVIDGFNEMVEELQTYIDKVYLAQICQKDAELNALKMQIQPHFLYNTLDVIRMVALDNDDPQSAKLLESLAFQLRYVIGEQTDLVPLSSEFTLLREYFVIMKVRYENRISLDIHVSPEDEDLRIPKMILQPFVENAVRHGLREKPGKGTVSISAARTDGKLRITIMDNGVGMPRETLEELRAFLQGTEGIAVREGRFSLGMKNVYDRIRLNCGPEYGYQIDSYVGMGTIVTLTLPINEGGSKCE